jgi:hypothetical protein
MTDEIDRSAFGPACEAAHARLEYLDAEESRVRASLDRVLRERKSLLKIIEGIEGLPGAGDGEGGSGPKSEVPPLADGPEVELDGELPQPDHTTRRIDPKSTAYRVGLFLKNQVGPLSRNEIVSSFETNGWVDSDWKYPRGTIFGAIQRAADYGWIERVEGTKDSFRTTLVSNAGTEADPRGEGEGS